MKTTKHCLLPAAVLSAFVFVAGCGGGGGGGGDAAVAAVTPAAAPAASTAAPASTIVTALVPSSYAADSEELAAFNLLNVERDRCGFGRLAQNAQLDAAAKGHADYQILNNLLTHVQNASVYPRGFTGTLPADRVAAAGYLGAGGITDEIVGFFGTARKTGLGADGVRGLLSAPYHLRGLMGGYRDVGVSVRSSADVAISSPMVYLQIDAAYKAGVGPQLFGTSEVNTYPCEGTTGVNRQLSNETPNPVPGRDLAVNPLGAVVYVAVREGNTLLISSAAMIEVPTGRSVTLRAPVTAANDPYGNCLEGCYKPHQAYVAADAPLLANAFYQVLVNGSNNGVPFSRVFTFVTGTGG
jgi:uncharacterized protein YkwD